MATRPRTRKRVCAIRRAPDGSAFEKCETCGVSVAVAFADMHECEPKMDAKRFKRISGSRRVPKTRHSLWEQPISPFRVFMESFMKGCEMENLIEVDRMGFERWKNMSKEERRPYAFQAGIVNSAHQETLNREANDMIKVNDEADSAMVGKFDKSYLIHEECSESSEYYTGYI